MLVDTECNSVVAYSLLMYVMSPALSYIAAAVYVSCQELNSTLREGNFACPGDAVNFICAIRGSSSFSSLILAWSSIEYIGGGDPLRFTTQDTPRANTMTSVINSNVTATLTYNGIMGGVRVLVSELRIVADQASVMTCTSVTTSTTATRMLNISGTCIVCNNITLQS